MTEETVAEAKVKLDEVLGKGRTMVSLSPSGDLVIEQGELRIIISANEAEGLRGILNSLHLHPSRGATK